MTDSCNDDNITDGTNSVSSVLSVFIGGTPTCAEKKRRIKKTLEIDDKAQSIVNLEERVRIMEKMETIYKNKIKYWEEYARNVSSMSSKKVERST